MPKASVIWSSILFLCAAIPAHSGAIEYSVSINTSGISGTVGSLDVQFNPGPLVTQSASLQILNFTTNGTLPSSMSLTGDVNGALPGALVFNNGSGFNDYFQGFTFGTTLIFDLSINGPALSSPDGMSTSGSTFAFGMFLNPAGTIPVLTTDLTNGFAFTVDVNLDGSTTLTNFSPEASISTASAVPEPSSIVLIGIAIAGTWFRLQRRPHAGCVRVGSR